MYRAVIQQDGSLQLGQDAAAKGYTPGTVVVVSVNSSGSLFVALDDSPPALDVSWQALEGGRAQLMLRQAPRRRRAG